jgi:NADPH:quinone reductase-like Zn-dependent oxidoreductase
MRSLLSTAPGGPQSLKISEIAAPEPAPGELLVRVRACGINYPDVLIIEDKYQFKPARPFAPGSEIAGIVEAVGKDVTGFSVGDRVMAVTLHGGLSELIALPAGIAFHVPDTLGDVEAAALLMTYATTRYALATRAELQPGETLLVLGAAGGVGLAAIEIGKAMGARVVAAVSSQEKAGVAKQAGADEAVVYPRAGVEDSEIKALGALFKQAIGPKGADVVYDPVGGDYTEAALRAIAWNGRYLVIGFAAGIPRIPLNLALIKGCDIRGVFWGEFARRNPEANRRNVEELLALHAAGSIRPFISETYPLERGGEAIARLATRQAVGKVVVTID